MAFHGFFFFAGRDVVLTNDSVIATGGQRFAVAGECEGGDRGHGCRHAFGSAVNAPHFLAGFRFKESDLVASGQCQRVAIGMKHQGINGVGIFEFLNNLFVLQVPQLCFARVPAQRKLGATGGIS